MNPGLIGRFPSCKHYVEEFISNKSKFSSNYPRVFNAFVRACTLELDNDQISLARARVDEVLTLGSGPTVVPKALSSTECGLFHPGAAGLQFGERRYIYVAPMVLDAYEHGTGWIVLEGVLLHECVHWVRFHAGNGDEEGGEWNTASFDRFADNSEVGEMFDLWAYGFNPCTRGRDGKLVQYGPPSTVPKEDKDASKVPAWARGWWAVYDGNYYYYYFYPDGMVIYIKTKPDPTWLPPRTVGNQGQVTMASHGLSIIWNSTGRGPPTRETFTRLGWTSTTEMNGESNKYALMYAKKM
jgi:hypothetical protein